MGSYTTALQLLLCVVATSCLEHWTFSSKKVPAHVDTITCHHKEHEDCVRIKIDKEDCYIMCPDPEIDIGQVMGQWHIIMGMSTTYKTTAFCAPLTLARNRTHVLMSWALNKASRTRSPIPGGAHYIAGPSLWREVHGSMEVKLLRHVNDHLIVTLSEHDKEEVKVLLLCRYSQPSLEPQNVIPVRRALHQTGVWAHTSSHYMCFTAYQ